MLATLLSAAAKADDPSWLSRNSTVVVSITAVVFSALVGPTVTAYFLGKRERSKDRRAFVAAHRDDLRTILDECAVLFATAVTKLRVSMNAKRRGEDPPPENLEFLSPIPSLGQRLRLRLPPEHEVLVSFETAKERLYAIRDTIGAPADFETAADDFESARHEFLERGRVAVQRAIEDKDEY